MRPEVLLALVTVCAASVPAAYNQYQQSTGHWWPSALTQRGRRDSGESDGRRDNSGEVERWQPARRGHLSHRQVGAMIGGIATGRRLPVQQQWPRADHSWSSGGRRQQQDSTEDRWTGRGTTQDSGERTGYGTNQHTQQGERGRGDDSQERSDAYTTRQTPYWRGRYPAEQQRSEPLRRGWGGQGQDSGEDQTRRGWGAQGQDSRGGQDQNSGEDQTRRGWGAQGQDSGYGQGRSWGAQGQNSGDSNERQNPYSWGRQGRDRGYGQGQDSNERQDPYNWGAQRRAGGYGQGGDSGDSGEDQTRTRYGTGGRHTSVWPTDDSNSNENGRQGDSWLNWFG